METGYIFVSYAHKDKRAVLKEISKREKNGQKFWYDKSIEAGADWAESIGKNLEKADSVLYFKTPAAEKSDNCKRELSFAKEHGIPVETVNLGGPLGTIIGILLLVGALAFLVYFAAFKYVPNVTGYKTEDAIKKLDDYGYSAFVRYEYSDEYPMGLIMKQSPVDKAFRLVPVFLKQSIGPEESLTVVPDTVGLYVSEGMTLLADSGMTKIYIIAENLGSSEFGTITNQTAPAGYKVSVNSNVGLTVATNDNPVVFTFNGTEITVPPQTGTKIEIDLTDNTVTITEPYKERVFEEAEYINLESEEWVFVNDKTYDVPVVISGENYSKIAFFGCTFNDDVIIKTENQMVIAGIEGSCTVNGNLCIINNIMDADVETPLPKFWIEEPANVIVEHGSGTCFMFADEEVIFNGERYSFSGCEYFIDESSAADSIVPIDESEKEPSMYVVTHLWEKGREVTRQMASDIKVPGRE